MAVPVIDPATSIHAYRMGEFWVYQPGASNSPTGWEAAGLPEGVTIDAVTGRIEGAGTEPGFYNVPIIASNGDGDSAPLFLRIGIAPSVFWIDASLDVEFNLPTGEVTNPAIAATGSEKPPAIITKKGDWVVLSVGLKKGGFFYDLPVVEMHLAIKEFESEDLKLLSSGAVEKVGSFDTARYQIVAYMDPDVLTGVLSSYEDDKNTYVDAVGEIRFTYQHIKPGEVDASVLERSSANFTIRIARDLAPDIGT